MVESRPTVLLYSTVPGTAIACTGTKPSTIPQCSVPGIKVRVPVHVYQYLSTGTWVRVEGNHLNHRLKKKRIN